MLKPLKSLLFLGLLTGCGVSAEDYAAEVAIVECDLYESCDLLDAFGGTRDECVEAIEVLESARASSDGCDYSSAEARRCIDDLSSATCDDLSDAALEGESPCEMVCAGG